MKRKFKLIWLIFISNLVIKAISIEDISQVTVKEKNFLQKVNASVSMTSENSTDFLALGDSYTIGEGITQNESWPYQLAGRFNNSLYNMTEPSIIANTGWTSGYLIEEIRQNQPNRTFDFVFLLIGVNDQYNKLELEQDLRMYQSNFNFLLKIANYYARGDWKRVIVLSIPDYSTTPYVEDSQKNRIAYEIYRYNQINYAQTKKTQANYVNITKISQLAAEDNSLLSSDQLHYSKLMYRLWVDHLENLLNKLLAKPQNVSSEISNPFSDPEGGNNLILTDQNFENSSRSIYSYPIWFLFLGFISLSWILAVFLRKNRFFFTPNNNHKRKTPY